MDKGRTTIGRVLPLWSGWLVLILVTSIVLLSVFAWLAARSLETLALRGEWLTHTERVRYEIGGILQSLTDIETGERG
jgi:CHASE3 domain sensor protein